MNAFNREGRDMQKKKRSTVLLMLLMILSTREAIVFFINSMNEVKQFSIYMLVLMGMLAISLEIILFAKITKGEDKMFNLRWVLPFLLLEGVAFIAVILSYLLDIEHKERIGMFFAYNIMFVIGIMIIAFVAKKKLGKEDKEKPSPIQEMGKNIKMLEEKMEQFNSAADLRHTIERMQFIYEKMKEGGIKDLTKKEETYYTKKVFEEIKALIKEVEESTEETQKQKRKEMQRALLKIQFDTGDLLKKIEKSES